VSRSRAALAVLFGLTSSMLVPMGGREEPRVRPEEAVGTTVVVCGRIALYGNEPHTYVGLLARPEEQPECTADDDALTAGRLLLEDDTVFRIEGEPASELQSLQSRRASVVGELESAGEPPAPPPLLRVESYRLLDE
jgi:hypothetical protein